MKSLKYIFFLVLTLFIGTSIYVATLDGNFDVKQTRFMKAPVEVAFNNVNDFKNWEYWSPWIELDSTIVVSYPEITSGVGASFTWSGKEGLGSLKTISTITNKEIIQQIDFGSDSKPKVYWEFKKVKEGTEVTWEIKGTNTFREKIYWLINGGIEKKTTPIYKRGLELLAQQLQKEMDIHSIDYKGIVYYGGGYYLYQTIACKNEVAAKKMTEMFPVIINYMAENKIEASGKPFTLNHEVDLENNTVLFSTCIPVKEKIITEDPILTGYLAPQKTFKIIFNGNYKFLPASWPTFYKTLNDQGYTEIKKGFSVEIYTTNPSDSENPANWLTEIYIPIN